MSVEIRRAEINAFAQPEPKRRKIVVKQELADDYPDFPTLMELDPEYAAKVEQWQEFLEHNYPDDSTLTDSEFDASLSDSDFEADVSGSMTTVQAEISPSESASEADISASEWDEPESDMETSDCENSAETEFRFDFEPSESEPESDEYIF